MNDIVTTHKTAMLGTGSFPRAALEDRIGVVGTTGSGKTYGTGVLVEKLLHAGARAMIHDPLGVWWGLRQDADGKSASKFDVVIFGGPHADIEITPEAGALIGETIAGMRESAIIDLSRFETAASERRFMLAVLNSIYRKASGEPLHMIFDEADLLAPEKIMDKEGDATKLHGMMQTVVRRGRVRGLTSWLITQRPAALSKQVLSQVDGLIAFALTSSQDRKALWSWIEGQADKERGAEILGGLAAKQVGEAVVWLPRRGILADVRFPEKITYDSSRTPKRGEKVRTINLKALDITALKERLATVEQKAKADRPEVLRAEIRRLEAELRKPAAPPVKAGTATPDARAIVLADRAGYDRAMAEAGRTIGEFEAAMAKMATDTVALIRAGAASVENAAKFLDAGRRNVAKAHKLKPTRSTAPVLSVVGQSAQLVSARAQDIRPPIDHPVQTAVNVPTPEGGSIAAPLQKILDAIAWWNALGIEQPLASQVGFVARYKPRGGSWDTYRSRLRGAGLIEYHVGGRLTLTEEGVRLASAPDAPPSPEEFRERVYSLLDAPLVKLLKPLVGSYPDSMGPEEWGAASGYQPRGGSWDTYRSRLKGLDLITYPNPGIGRAADWLFP